MIKTDTFEINGRSFIRTYSDEGRYIVGGVPEGQYTEAVDPTEFGRTYVEGELISSNELENSIAQKAEAYDILMGE